ncbi:MAG: AsmA family protein, partial [Gammaproteobacteria bacterium]
KPQIAEAVESATGRKLNIEGDLGLSVFPWLGLEVGPTSLSNAPGFSERAFVQVEAVEVSVKLMPLLRKELQMDTILLQGLKLSLETDAAGKTNWADLAAGAEGEAPPPEQPPEEAGGQLALAGLAIGGVEITDAAVLWDDRQAGTQYRIERVNLETGAIAPGEAVPVHLEMQLAASDPEISGPVELDATVALSADRQVVQIDDARFSAGLSGAGLPGGALKPELSFHSRIDLGAQTLDVSELKMAALEITIEGGLSGTQILDDPTFGGELRIGEFVPREVIQALGQPVPEVSDPKVLTRADGRLQLAATTDSLAVPQLQLRLDDSTLKGDVKVSNFAKPAIRFGLQLDQIDVDRYLPPRSEAPAPAAPAPAAAAGGQMIPVEALRGLDVDGKLTIGRLKAAQMLSTDIVMQLVAKDGLVRVHPASARMYEGQYQGDVTLDVRGGQPKISLNEKLAGVQVGPLLEDMLGEARLSGATQATAQLTAVGQTPDEFKRTLNGQLAFAFNEGAVQGFNLAAMIRKARARLKGEPPPADTGPNQTDFSELAGTATVTNGVIRNQDLSAKSPLLRVEGEGTVNLPQETLDYRVTAKVVGSLEGQGGKELTDLRGVAIPIQVAGTFAEPSYKIRLDEAVREVAEEKVKEKVQEEVEEKIGDKLEKQFGDSIKGLFR